ncbi:poly(ADP-ribose) glycohydrolase-like [Diabrotica undecimpunctata]|uniref:poly(ADP-ribose) glycohydrolase-like n=1 Tax=Diabrotica undecimpunctata TaxID=50387 RepID=UPI003B640B44
MAQNEAKTWVGSSLSQICNNKEVWSFNVCPVTVSKNHAVLFKLPVTLKDAPEPYKNSEPQYWDNDHVRMPYSEKSLFPVEEGGSEVIKLRWNLIEESLLRPIHSSLELEAAIRTYNSSLPEFTALHSYFEQLEEEESQAFFKELLPKMISLALNLPQILPGNLPLLTQNHSRSVSLSQLQIASLLANAFFCTFPWRKSTANTYPGVNFITLFRADRRPKRLFCIYEKFKCMFNYFRMITSSVPVGVVTFERKYVPKTEIPRWDSLENNLGNIKVHIDSSGTIEDNGLGFLQVDFANKNVGGGVLGYGCVQEEIRFVICPELIISRLFVEQLTDLEAVVITGVQRYSNYSGYGDSFTWEEPCKDQTPYDEYGRRRTSVCIIDATKYNKVSQQFYPSAMLREVNKAYVGFSSKDKTNLAPVATGNWGCGAFNGSLYVKSLLQLMACSAAGRHLVYYTFGNTEFRDEFYKMYTFLATNDVKIEQLWKLICGFVLSKKSEEYFYSYIQQAYFDSRRQTSIKNFFKPEDPGPSTSAIKPKKISFTKVNRQNDKDLDIVLSNADIFEKFFSDSPPEDESITKKKKVANGSKLPQKIDSIGDLIDGIDTSSFYKQNSRLPQQKYVQNNIGDLIDNMDNSRTRKYKEQQDNNADSLLNFVDTLHRKKIQSEPNRIEEMEIDTVEDTSEVVMEAKARKKITEYFQKVP